MRAALTWVLRVVLRVFFRRVEVKDLAKLPSHGPAIVVLNHPNGLVDPLFILCLSPRPASFLAKAPLFKMPILGLLVRALDCIPVYRKQDNNSDPAKTRETFSRARTVLATGGVLALFPEGTTHDDPRMRPLKTGAARIALGAASLSPDGLPVKVVPAGLTFPEKGRFRSDALLQFGEGILVPATALDPDGEPPAPEVDRLTREIEERIEALVLQAETTEALALASSAEEILSSVDDSEPALAQSVAIRQQIVDGYSRLRLENEGEIGQLARRIRRFGETIRGLGLDPRLLSPDRFTFSNVSRVTLRTFLLTTLLLPIAIPGILLHYPAYRVVGFLARKMAKGDESVLATVKILASLVFYPLTWLLLTAGFYAWLETPWSMGLLLFGPLCAWLALYLLEHLDTFLAGARGLFLLSMRKPLFLQLTAERDAIRKEILAFAASIGGGSSGPKEVPGRSPDR